VSEEVIFAVNADIKNRPITIQKNAKSLPRVFLGLSFSNHHIVTMINAHQKASNAH
jgi:hypothetical protein